MGKILKQFFFALLACVAITSAHAAESGIAAGDLIKIMVFNHPDLSIETKVNDAGNVSYPLLGEVKVEGLSPTAASKKIAALLASGGFVRNAQVNVTVTFTQSQQVSVLGQVNRPGRYPVEGIRTITDILAMAGGINAEGGDVITLVRNVDGQSTKQFIDLSDVMKPTGTPLNVEVKPGDTIYVDRAPRFYIYGEVQRPGGYRLEKNMTVVQGISIGGGLTSRGTERGIQIKRRDENGQLQILPVKHDTIVHVDDVIYVRESLF